MEADGEAVRIKARSDRGGVICPDCASVGTRCHSTYWRRLADRPLGGRVVGALVDAEDDDYTEMVRADFVAIGELLERAGARQWTEPDLDEEECAEFEAWGYSGLHTIRRLAVHLAAVGRLPEPFDRTQRATADPLLSKVYEALPSDPPGPFDHLVHHSDCEGYYVPVDFAHVIVDKKGTRRLPGLFGATAGGNPSTR
ncbi:hypothetical protein MTF65_02550 [Streptomyces sp. APSN-46.1]|uniref:hypothetical protein n=1 Tax=Streptomyces sp. APSN-46.1 TaxID=2929049 RepID=UPI001FB41205|nr:hypothetical protein [Streptomyces sp. APSN-46.1]MCJ1676257.1 hypothetical protein [Streptomyces sp. APSN-46.1]